jgi:hypothetical protein
LKVTTKHIWPRVISAAGKILAAVLLLVLSAQLTAQTSASREYNIKAVFLYNFTQFVEWPSNTFNNPETPFVIGILGDDPFHSYIDETVVGEKVKGHAIVIKRYQNVNDVKNCQILFISSKEAGRIKEILFAVQNRNILTVSDIPNFATNGGMICLTTKDNKIKLQINPSSAKAADLNISSKLLHVAEIVGT